MMEPEAVAETILFACLQPPNVRIPQMTVRHMVVSHRTASPAFSVSV